MGVEGGHILLFVNSCTSRPQCISILRNIKFVHFLPNCTTLLQDLDLGITKYFQQLYRKHMVQKAACILDSEKDVTTEINGILRAIYIKVEPWQLMCLTQKIM